MFVLFACLKTVSMSSAMYNYVKGCKYNISTVSSVSVRSVNIIIYYILKKKKKTFQQTLILQGRGVIHSTTTQLIEESYK